MQLRDKGNNMNHEAFETIIISVTINKNKRREHGSKGRTERHVYMWRSVKVQYLEEDNK